MSGICDACKRNKNCRKPLDGMDSCRLYVSGKESNYERLFGTPERAARTLTHNEPNTCDECVLIDMCDIGMPATCIVRDYDALLEWLRGDAE